MDSNSKIKIRRCIDVDFVFIYEVKNRELQGIALIGLELIKRGFTVGYINTWHGLHHADIRYKAKVAIVFEAYNTDVINFALSFIDHCENVFNMQWEQLLNDDCLKENSIYLLRGDACKVYHASWGEKNKKHLIETCHIPEEKVKVVGHIGMDFVSKRFSGYYKSKDEILNDYSISADKKIVLFISSFAPPSLLDEERASVSVKSKAKIVEWLIKFSKENRDKCIIYRPHPTEAEGDEAINDMEKSGIHIIRDYSIQQWIVISDIILNWWSTSLADVYSARKTCVFLRPYKLPEKYEYHMFRDIRMATSYEEMLSQIDDHASNISEEMFSKYYYHDEEEPVYVRVVNELENIIKMDGEYVYDSGLIRELKERPFILDMREAYGYAKSYIRSVFGQKDSFEEIRYHRRMSKSQYLSEKRIAALMTKIRVYTF